MVKRKLKEEGAASVSQNTTVPAVSDLFKTLFGNVERIPTASSIFSDHNPFKRDLEKTNDVGNSNSNADDANRKRNDFKKLILEEDSIEKEATEVPNMVSDFDSLVVEPQAEGSKRKRKRKRKRDEVEREYEAQKYGVVPEDAENIVSVGEKRKKMDNEVNMLVSKDSGDGFDDEGKLLRTVFVGNLPLKAKKKVLIKEFSQFGEIESVRIRSVPILDTKIPRKGAILLKKINGSADSVNAYIVFRTVESAEASLAHNMAVVGGNHIRVDRACPPRKKLKSEDAPLYDNKRTLFVGNLPFDVKDEEIYQLFSSIKDLQSSIEAVRVIRHPHIGLGKGIAYALFKTREAANLALKKRNLNIRDRQLRLSYARQDRTPSKRRNSFAADSPAKRLAVESRPPDQNSVSNKKASNSYQGLRARKSGILKKHHAKYNGSVKIKSKNKMEEKYKEKRPAVAARKAKAKAKALQGGGDAKRAGEKRKLDSQTPESSYAKKKAKKFG